MGTIPDVPKEVKVQIHRENELEKEILFEDDEDVKNSDMLYRGSVRDTQGKVGSDDNLRFRGSPETAVTPL